MRLARIFVPSHQPYKDTKKNAILGSTKQIAIKYQRQANGPIGNIFTVGLYKLWAANNFETATTITKKILMILSISEKSDT